MTTAAQRRWRSTLKERVRTVLTTLENDIDTGRTLCKQAPTGFATRAVLEDQEEAAMLRYMWLIYADLLRPIHHAADITTTFIFRQPGILLSWCTYYEYIHVPVDDLVNVIDVVLDDLALNTEYKQDIPPLSKKIIKTIILKNPDRYACHHRDRFLEKMFVMCFDDHRIQQYYRTSHHTGHCIERTLIFEKGAEYALEILFPK